MDNLFAGLEISAREVDERRRSGEPLQLVDVREGWEWDYSHIPGAVHLPLSEMETRHAEVLLPGIPIVFYCHMGMRSQQAAIWMRQEGRSDCRSMAGGINAWADDIDPEMPRY